MKPPTFLRLPPWKMTPKLLLAFFLTAIVPVTAASVFSLSYFYRVSYEGARATLTKELEAADQLAVAWAQGQQANTQLVARESLVVINLSLGLAGPVVDYLDTLQTARRLAFARLLDAEGTPFRQPPLGASGSSVVPTSARLQQADAQDGVSWFAPQGERVLLATLVPVRDEQGQRVGFLFTGRDAGGTEAGDLLGIIQSVASGPVVLAGPSGVLSASSESPVWDVGVAWPDASPAPDSVLRATARGRTYVFGFSPLGAASEAAAWIGVSFSLDGFQQATDTVAGGMIVIAAFFVLLSLVLGVILARTLTRPLLLMANQAEAWTEGQGGRRLDVTTQDEAGMLGRSFNQVLDRLDATLESLRKTQNYLKNIFNSLTSVLISVDETGTVQEWNVAAERFNGTKAAEVIGRRVWDLSPVFEGLEPLVALAVVTREPQFLNKNLGRGRDQRNFDLGLYPLVWNGVSGVVIRMDDVTDSVRKDRQLQQAQKMETVGTLTEGIAHNFNNLLTGITGTVSLVGLDLEEYPLDVEQLRARMAMIEDSTKKAATIVRRLMSLSRGGTDEFVTVDLVTLLKEVEKTSRMVLDKSVEVELTVPETALVTGDHSQLEQCLLNLVINSAHAMTLMRPRGEHRGGSIRLNLSAMTAVNDFLASHPEAVRSDYWLIQVQDTGVGISPEHLSKIFDPFFTTKDLETGSGLGLAMVYASVRQHHGFIDVYSEVGQGTTFSLYLPMLPEATQVTPPLSLLKLEGYHRGQGLVLVVDDEVVVQTTARLILEACGYTVITANNGVEALRAYELHRRQIRVVLLDSSMPKLSGAETLEALRRMDPEVKVIVSSGLPNRDRIVSTLGAPYVRFLAKPYSLAELSLAVHHLLSENP